MSIIIRDLFIDTVACIGKIHIEKSDMKPIFKDICKFSVDLVAEFLKKNYNHDISSIRTEAKWCGVEKVIAIPYNFADGTKTVLLRTYGGNHDKFFKQIGCSSIPQANTVIDFELIEMLEHKYGVEIYNASINQGESYDQL